MTKQEIWDAIATLDNWDPNEGDKELFFSDRLDIDVAKLSELRGVSIPGIIDELRQRPNLEVSLFRWGAAFESTDVADCNDQDHWPSWGQAATEDCSRSSNGQTHSVQWAFG